MASVVANAAIVPADENGSISIFVTDPTDVIVNVTGYYIVTPAGGTTNIFPSGAVISTAAYTIQNTDTGSIYTVSPNTTSITLPTCAPGKRLTFASTATPPTVAFHVAGSDHMMVPGSGLTTSYSATISYLTFVCTPIGWWQYSPGL